MFCSKCGDSLTQGAEFCAKCGIKVGQQNAAADAAATPKQPNAAEKIAELSAEKWKELSPKAQEAAAIAAEKASAVSKDILGELKKSGAAFRQAIDENKGDGTETRAKVFEKTATSFLGMLSGKQKAILAGAAGLALIMVFWLFGGDSDLQKMKEFSCNMVKMEQGKLSPSEAAALASDMSTGLGGARDRLREKYKGREDELALIIADYGHKCR